MAKKGMAPGGAEDQVDSSDAPEDGDQETEKSHAGVTEDELTKALDMLEGAAQTTDDEKQTLLSKAMDGSISPEENDRLAEILSGRSTTPSVADEVVKSVQPSADERLQKSLDVSPYLTAQHEGLLTALTTVAESLEKSDSRQHNFNVILAKSMRAVGGLVKAINDRLAVIEGQPVSGPKALQSPAQVQHLQKSFGGQGGQGSPEKLSKGEVLDTLEQMNVDSMEKGRGGMARCGEDLTKAIAKYEGSKHISRPLYDELKHFRQQRAAN